MPAIKDNYQKRRAKAYIEKAARIRKLNTVTLEFAERFLGELGHEESVKMHRKQQADGDSVDLEEATLGNAMKLIARDSQNNLLKSVFDWTEEAVERILRVPAGFMRDRVQDKVENMALDERAFKIGLALVEKGIAMGRQMMEEMLKTAGLDRDSTGNRKGGKDVSPEPEYGSTQGNDFPPNRPPKEMMNEEGIMSALEKKRAGL